MPLPASLKVPTGNGVTLPQNCELFCFHIQQLESETCLNDFINHINNYLPEYVFNRQTLSAHEKRLKDGQTTKTTIERAREFLQKTQAERAFDSGEFGEFLLYLFATKVKGALKLTSRLQSRGSIHSTIPGRDSTYAFKDEDGCIYMLVGEAKTKPDSNDGLREAQRDLNNFWDTNDIDYEIHLASTHIRSEMTEKNIDLYEAYFIDDNKAHAELKYKNIVFVGYSHKAISALKDKSINSKMLYQTISKDLQRCFENQRQLINKSPYPTIYCFVPFESIDDARDLFAQSNNLVIKT
ncbi:DUF1837 domain-containing protein [candidate division TA06 bacterium]|nr:DUF1837 domain-containing protein [candidate division TA06 bacterium]